jgi:hypothetical protein
MGGNHSVRSVVLLRAPGRAQGGTNVGSCDVGDVRRHHWCVAGYGCKCAGIFGSGLDRRAKASRSGRMSAIRANAAFRVGISRTR